MALVLIAIVQAAVECPVNLTFLFFVSVACIYIVTGALHFDPITLMCGIIYWLLIPSCFIFLQVGSYIIYGVIYGQINFFQVYSIANLNDVSWGTRSGPAGGVKKLKIRKKKKAVGFIAKLKQFIFGPEYIEEEVETDTKDEKAEEKDEKEEELPPEPDLDYDEILKSQHTESIEQLYGGIHPQEGLTNL